MLYFSVLNLLNLTDLSKKKKKTYKMLTLSYTVTASVGTNQQSSSGSSR